MRERTIRSTVIGIALSMMVVLFPCFAQAKQPEPSCQCVEGEEPLSMNYGEHTIDCQIADPTDTDKFSFYGVVGDEIRVIVSRTSGNLYPRLEIWDPDDQKIVDEWDPFDVAVDATLVKTGAYLIAVSDNPLDYTGEYNLQLEKIPPVFAPPGIPYDSPESDEIDLDTDMDFFVFEGANGANIRLVVSRASGNLYPRLEVWDPDGQKIVDEWDPFDVSVEETLAKTGTYVMAVSDQPLDYTGAYEAEIHCLTGPCPQPPVQPDVSGCIRERGQPLVGKRVKLIPRRGDAMRTKTDQYGKYEFFDIPSGRFTVKFRHSKQ